MGICASKNDSYERKINKDHININPKSINAFTDIHTRKYDCTKLVRNYYLFHRKIEDILSKGKSQITEYDKSKGILNYNIQTFYLLNISLVESWKKYVDYQKRKSSLDNFYHESDSEHLQKIYTYKPFSYNHYYNDNSATYQKFISNNKLLEIKDFDYLVDEKTYDEFKNEIQKSDYSSSYDFESAKKYRIKGFISAQMIFLFFDNNYIIRIFYRGSSENQIKIIQLTINCIELDKQTNKIDKKKNRR